MLSMYPAGGVWERQRGNSERGRERARGDSAAANLRLAWHVFWQRSSEMKMEIDASHTRTVCLPLSLSVSLSRSPSISLSSPFSFLHLSPTVSVSACRSRVAKRSKAFNAHAQNSNHITYTQRCAGNRKRAHITLAMGQHQQQQQRHEGVAC